MAEEMELYDEITGEILEADDTDYTSDLDIITVADAADMLQQYYRLYAKMTILERAIPDVRDGLKPVQRRIIYAMHDLGLFSSRPHRKSARIVGEVLGKWHPHGDQAVYSTLARMAQDFSMRELLVDGQGNFGSIDGDSPAAMRYTEARLAAVAHEMLHDIDMDTVDWTDNFDGSLREPVVLPTRLPQLLINGVTGIATGVATSIPPHNTGEICDAITYILDNWGERAEISTAKLMEYVPGPDFPTGGIVLRMRGDTDVLYEGYDTGRSSQAIVVQGQVSIAPIGGGKSQITITELPYGVAKASLVEKIVERANDDKIEGIADIADISDANGIEIAVEVMRGYEPRDVLADLLAQTPLSTFYSFNVNVIDGRTEDHLGELKQMSLREMLVAFVDHRVDVITRRSEFELEKKRARLHIVEGLLKALDMLDEVVEIIRRSRTPNSARNNLMKNIGLSEEQAQAVLDMQLRRLCSLERNKLKDEAKALQDRIDYLVSLLEDPAMMRAVIKDEITEIKVKYATPRRTLIINDEEVDRKAGVTLSELQMPEDEQIVIVTADAIRRMKADDYRTQSLTGPEARTATLQPEEWAMFITNRGRAWATAIGNLSEHATIKQLWPAPENLQEGERVIAVVPYSGAAGETVMLDMVTKEAQVKRVQMESMRVYPNTWQEVIGFRTETDELIFAAVSRGGEGRIVASNGEKTIQFEEADVRPQESPSATGVIAMKLGKNQAVMAAALIEGDGEEGWIVTFTRDGSAKRVPLTEYPTQGRGGQGVQNTSKKDKAAAVLILEQPPEGIRVFDETGAAHNVAWDSIADKKRPNICELVVGLRAPLAGILPLYSKLTTVAPVPTGGEGLPLFEAAKSNGKGKVPAGKSATIAKAAKGDLLVVRFEADTLTRTPLADYQPPQPNARLMTENVGMPPIVAHVPDNGHLMLITNLGRAWTVPAADLKDRIALQTVMKSRSPFEKGEFVVAMAPFIENAPEEMHLVTATREGSVRRTMMSGMSLREYDWLSVMGLKADSDRLLMAEVSPNSTGRIVMASNGDKVLQIEEADVNPQASPTATGVIGMKLGKGEGLIAAKVVQDPLTAWVVAITGPGGAKRTPLEEYSVQGRNTQGVQTIGGSDPVVATVITDGEPAGLHVYDANGHRRDIAWRAIPVKKRAHTAEPVIDMLGKVTFAKAIR